MLLGEAEKYDLSRLKIHRTEGPQQPSSRPRSGLILYIFGAIVLTLAVFFFIRLVVDATEIVEVTTVSLVSPSQANTLLTASGYVVAQRKASVASKATGRLVYLGVREGDKVKKGEIIARIESADVEATLEQARADLQVAEAERQDALRTLERSRQLYERQLISQAEFDAAQARYDRVVALIRSREASVRAAEVQLENTRIRAPFDGTVLSKNADVGEVVAPFAAGASSRVAVVTIADMASLEVEADVSESNIVRISPGQPCEVALDAYPDRRYQAVVDKIVPTADRAKATVLTKVRFIEQDARVLPEMSAKVHFLSRAAQESSESQPKLAVDPSAVVTRDGKKVVFKLDENTTRMVHIDVGGAVGRNIEVISGLAAGDRVVLYPTENLESGTQVQVKGEK